MTNPDWTVEDLWNDHAQVCAENEGVIVEFHEAGLPARTLGYSPDGARELATILNQAATAAEK